MRIIVGITGGSGAIYALGLLQALRILGVETHLIISPMGEKVIAHECGFLREDMGSLASCIYEADDLFAPTASGTFRTDGMVIVPCSMKTLSAVASGYSDSLLSRSADVILKEGRRLVIVPREMPLNQIHLENMLRLSQTGAVIMPACPGFYRHPQSVADMVSIMVGKILDAFGIEHSLATPWGAAEL